MTTANVVFSGPAGHEPLKQEANVAADEVILPGNLVEVSSAGAMSNHSSEGQGGEFFVADMNYYEQKNVDDALPEGSNLDIFVPSQGEYYNLRVGASQTINRGTGLTSAGDGTVKVAATDGTEEILFYASEALVTGVGESGRVKALKAMAGHSSTGA